MSFWNDLGKGFEDFGKGFVTGVTDVGTSATRIVTDTAIDIGDVATGFQFTDEMNKAKQAMTDAGVLSAADAIQKNHYPDIKKMEARSLARIQELGNIMERGKSVEQNLVSDISLLSDMCADVSNLAAESEEASALLKKAEKIPDWKHWKTVLDIPDTDLAQVQTLSAATAKWERVGRDLVTTGLVTNVTDGLAGLAALGAMSKARKLSKSVKLAKLGAKNGTKAGANVARLMAKSAKFMKIGKMAGRASGALAVVTIGLDIGVSVAELEMKKSSLKSTLKDLDKGIREANESVADIKSELEGVTSQINALLRSVKPTQSRSSWDAWVETTRVTLQEAIRSLISVNSIISMAEKKALQTRGRPLEARIDHVAAIDPDISREEARNIIIRMDKSMGIVDTIELADSSRNRFSELNWRSEGDGQHELHTDTAIDKLSFSYGYAAGSDADSWTVYATAPWSRAFQIRWSYRGSHQDQPAMLALFRDHDGIRQFSTIHDNTPGGPDRIFSGTTTMQLEKGEVFGLTLNLQTSTPGTLQEICGSYARHPIENDWHTGVIGLKNDSDSVLEWRNQAGAAWDLLPHLAADKLLKEAGSPYQDAHPGSNEFIILRQNQNISGFEFMGEVYARISPPGAEHRKVSTVPAIEFGSVTLEFIV